MKAKFMTLEYFKADDGMPGRVRSSYLDLGPDAGVDITLHDGEGGTEKLRAKVRWVNLAELRIEILP